MAKPLALMALEAVKKRLSSIRRADQYQTDAGKNIYLGPVSLSGDIDEAVVVEFASETAATQSANGSSRSYTLTRVFTVSGLIRSDPKCEKGEAMEFILADIKRALFIYEKPGLELLGKKFAALSYISSRLLPRADGNEFEAVEVSGKLLYQEGYGDPYAAR